MDDYEEVSEEDFEDDQPEIQQPNLPQYIRTPAPPPPPQPYVPPTRPRNDQIVYPVGYQTTTTPPYETTMARYYGDNRNVISNVLETTPRPRNTKRIEGK